MPATHIDIGSIYEMENGSTLKITGEHSAPDGHMRVTFEIIDGHHSGFLDASKDDFIKAVKCKI